MTTPDVLEAAKPWMQPCGRCDGGLPMGCTCTSDDPRGLITRMAREVKGLRAGVTAMLADFENRDPADATVASQVVMLLRQHLCLCDYYGQAHDGSPAHVDDSACMVHRIELDPSSAPIDPEEAF